jgi:hypothetical protein
MEAARASALTHGRRSTKRDVLPFVILSWDDWNVDHVAQHGVTRAEAEYVHRIWIYDP